MDDDRSLNAITTFFGLVVSLVACVSTAAAQPAAPWETRNDTSAVRFYLDVSASMQGYDRRPSAPLTELARESKRWLVSLGVTRFEAAGFGTALGPVTNAALDVAVRLPSNQKDTCLLLPVQEEIRRLRANRGTDKRMMVVVTDGEPSASKLGACGTACPSGDDVTCAAQGIKDYVSAGFGLWVVGLRLPFSGTYYPPAGRAVRLPEPVGRPLYFWIASPSVRQGEGLVQRVADWADQRGIDVTAMDVWPGRWQGWVLASGVTARSFAIPRGEMDVCVRRTNVSLNSLPTSENPRVTLRSRSATSSRVWAVRLPLAPIEIGLSRKREGFVSLFESYGRPSWGGQPWTLLAKGDGALACLTWEGSEKTFALEWTTQKTGDLKMGLAKWSASSAGDPSTTFGLVDLWSLVRDLLASSAVVRTTPLLDVIVR